MLFSYRLSRNSPCSGIPSNLPKVTDVKAVDVCTKSFSIIYTLSEPYQGQGDLALQVYDSMGDLIREGITIERESAGRHESAGAHASIQSSLSDDQLNGVVKFTVKGLSKNTHYFYQLTANGAALLPPIIQLTMALIIWL